MSDFWNRVAGIKQQQNAAALASQDAAISKATDFWNRVEGIEKIDQQRNGAYHELMANSGNNPDALIGLQLGYTPTELPTFQPRTPGKSPAAAPSSAAGIASSSVPPSVFDYLNADLAKHYGMSKSTAYQEALENTAYQRAMKDMKAAGLNPAVMFGSGRAQGAGSNVYPSEQQAGGSGGYSRRSGGSSKNDKMFSSSMYGALSAIGGLIGIAATGRPDGFWIGSQVSQGAMHLMNAFNKR